MFYIVPISNVPSIMALGLLSDQAEAADRGYESRRRKLPPEQLYGDIRIGNIMEDFLAENNPAQGPFVPAKRCPAFRGAHEVLPRLARHLEPGKLADFFQTHLP
ncbi:MAG: hypothetical protein Q7S35_08660 [Candidatus Limnocylindrales bacterium]|nr:hypothetical protein [Candidatus Limnocylindrales bacterium]